MHSHNYDIILEELSGSNMAHILYNVMQSCDATKMYSGLYEKEKKPVFQFVLLMSFFWSIIHP